MMNKEKCIGVFDSGVGGLTAIKAIEELLPNEDIVFFGDTKNLPYGGKSREEIVSLAFNSTKFIKTFDVKAILVACGTVDSNALDELKKANDLPIFGVIKPACIKANEISINKNVGVIATNASVKANGYGKCLLSFDNGINAYQQGCPKLTPLIEQGRTDDEEVNNALNSYIDDLNKLGIDTLILGCTHYPLLEKQIHQIIPNIQIVNSSYQAVVSLKEYLEEHDLLNEHGGNRRYFVSGDVVTFERNAKLFLNEEIKANTGGIK